MPKELEQSARATRRRRFDPDTEVQLLLRAALTVIAKHGYENAGVAQILAEAGLTTRSFYRHFASKDDLIRALYLANAEAAAERLAARLADAPTPTQGLEAWIDEILSFVYDSRKASRVAVISSPGARATPGFEEIVADGLRLLIAPLQRVLEAGLLDGSFPDAIPVRDAPTIHAMVWGIIEWYRVERRLSRTEALSRCMRFALPALGAKSGSRPRRRASGGVAARRA
jgi:AcrR family transcriptional regulator